MVIRGAQIESLSNDASARFEDDVSAHLTRCFPDKSKDLGEPQVRETIRYGTKQAAQYGITAQRDVCKYVDLMFVFGRDFDTDPAQPWASSILHDWAYREPTVRMEALYEAGKKQETKAGTSGGL